MIPLLIVTTRFGYLPVESLMNSKKLITSRRGRSAPNIFRRREARLTFTAIQPIGTAERSHGQCISRVSPWPSGLSPLWYSECCNAD